MSELAKLLEKPEPIEVRNEENKMRMKMLALILANKALTAIGVDEGEEEDFLTPEGDLDYSKAVPTVPWVG
jgi:hypothetical protein